MNLRCYQPDDYRDLLSFLRIAFHEMWNDFLLDEKDTDIHDLDRAYCSGRASFYVVEDQGKICGSAGLRKLSDNTAELKRLYLAPECRTLGLGRALYIRAIQDAHDFGYKYLRLDTTRKSRAAAALFKELGFHEIPRYNSDPFAEIFMEMAL